MRCMKALIGALAASSMVAGCVPPPTLQSVMAAARGTSADDAFVVGSVEQEYKIVQALGLERGSQALHQINGKAYDVLTVRDPETGKTRDVWFDVSRFYGRSLLGGISPQG